MCLASFQSSMRLGNEAKVKQCLLFLLYSPRKILHKPYRRGSYNVIHESLCSTWCWLLRLPHIELLGKRNYVILKTRCVQDVTSIKLELGLMSGSVFYFSGVFILPLKREQLGTQLWRFHSRVGHRYDSYTCIYTWESSPHILTFTVVYCDLLWYTVIYCSILTFTVVYCD